MAIIKETPLQDAPASVETTYTISVGDGFEGRLDGRAEEDWVGVELVAGRSYDIRLQGAGTDALGNPFLRIYNAAGEQVTFHSDFDPAGLDLFALAEFSPETGGVYYLSAGNYLHTGLNTSGGYLMTVADEEDDNTGTLHTVSPGGRFSGTLDGNQDEDWIRIELVAGETYTFTLGGIGPDVAIDTVLRLYDSGGEQVAVHDDVDYAAGKLNSELTFTPSETGTYYIGAGAYGGNPSRDNSGRYQVAVYDEAGAAGFTLTGTVDNDTHSGTLFGGPGDDVLDSREGVDWLEGGAGADVLRGGPDAAMARYRHSDAGVEVDLEDGTARGGHAEGDTFPGETSYWSADADNGLVVTRASDIWDLFGSPYDDVLAGSRIGNSLYGYYGDDALDGREGNDLLNGGPGADALRGGDGIDAVSYRLSDAGVEVRLHDGAARGGDAEGDTFAGMQTVVYRDAGGATREAAVPDIEYLFGSDYDDILAGDFRDNRLAGYEGHDELDGREGDDQLYGGKGNDALHGGEGDDRLFGGEGNDALHGGEGDDLLFGEDDNDALHGGEGDDQLYGMEGDDELNGEEGNDFLLGGPGADALSGGAGIDVAYYLSSDAGVEVRLDDGAARGGDAEGDTFTAMQTIEYQGAGGASRQVEVPDIENLTGSNHDDVLAGAHGANDIQGLAGNDALYGREGDDRLFGGAGNDILDGGEGDDDLSGGGGADEIIGGPGWDTAIYGHSPDGVEVNLQDGSARGGDAEGDTLGGIENLTGSEYADVLAGDAGDNRLEGLAGADELVGGPGRDTAVYGLSYAGVEVRLDDGTARGGDAEGDTLTGIENLAGSGHADVLAGDLGDNRLEGGDGNDRLLGQGGADVLVGGPGRDTAGYGSSSAGVEVRLHDGTARGGDAEGDTFGAVMVEYTDAGGNTQVAELPDIENLTGSNHADILVGDLRDNRLQGSFGDDVLDGRAGDDTLAGQGGADRLSGGPGSDTAAYSLSYAGVEVRLHEGTLRGGDAEGDSFAGTVMVEYTDAGGNTQAVELPDIENITGSDYADVLGGDLRDNRLEGSFGDDVLDGRAGDDTLAGQGGADQLIGGPGSDTAAYSLSYAGVVVNLHDGAARGGHAEGDTLSGIENLAGSAHGDVLTGDAGENRLQGAAGDDFLQGRGGADGLAGGPGLDAVVYWDSPAGVEVRLHDGTARGGDAEGDTFPVMRMIEYTGDEGVTREVEVSDVENLHGSGFDDLLAGDFGDNQLVGFAGNDTLHGRAGDDSLFGGMGDDELDGGEGDDLLVGGGGADTLSGGDGIDGVSYRSSDAGVVVRLDDGSGRGGDGEGDALAGIENLLGSRHDDVLAGDRADNVLLGSDGNDVLEGRAGNDRLEGGFGSDVLDGGEGDDVLAGQGGADSLSGGPGWDTAAYGLSYAGVVVRLHNGTARGGDAEGDTFAGTEVVEYTDTDGNLQVMEVPDIEYLTGSDHDDILAGDLRDNWLQGGGGDDTLYGGPGGGKDALQGGDGNDRLYGGIGNDYLEGNAGDDQLRGGADDDLLYGGAGADTHFFAPGGGNDIIGDFDTGEDKIDLTAFAEIRSIADLAIEQAGNHLEIDLSAQGGGTVTLRSTDEADILDEHIVFFVDDLMA